MNLTKISQLTKEEILDLIAKAVAIKANPEKYFEILKNKTMLMMFEKPSLRTRVSFEVAMTQLGGHAIFLDMKDAPIGEKESVEDTAKASSRFCDIIMARVFKQEIIETLASSATVPVINGLTNLTHPCQILSDLLTIKEKKGLENLKLAFVGDGNNNVTHSLLYGCSILGIDISIGCPKEAMPNEDIVNEAKQFAEKNGSKIIITNDAAEAVKDADIIYADSWMSYHISTEEEKERREMFMPYQVTEELMKKAKTNAIFMNCLPAKRGYEQTAEVIDGKQSVVFDQAENRLHMQKAIILKLLGVI